MLLECTSNKYISTHSPASDQDDTSDSDQDDTSSDSDQDDTSPDSSPPAKRS